MNHQRLDDAVAAVVPARTAYNPNLAITERKVYTKQVTVQVCGQWYQLKSGNALATPVNSKRQVVSADASDAPLLNGIPCRVVEDHGGLYWLLYLVPQCNVVVAYQLVAVPNSSMVVADE